MIDWNNYDYCLPEGNNAYISVNQTQLSDNVESAVSELSNEQPFVIFDLNLANTELSSLKDLRISNYKLYENYHNYNNLDSLTKEVEEFIELSGNEPNTAKQVAQLITRIVKESLLGAEKETAMVGLGATPFSTSFDIPRWHTDYGSDYGEIQYKIVAALKGPQTLFYPLQDEMRDEFYSIGLSNAQKTLLFEQEGNAGNRTALWELEVEGRKLLMDIIDASKIISAEFGQGAVFKVGDDYPAVHSEPPIHEERLFISILPGSKVKIQELYEKWYGEWFSEGKRFL